MTRAFALQRLNPTALVAAPIAAVAMALTMHSFSHLATLDIP